MAINELRIYAYCCLAWGLNHCVDLSVCRPVDRRLSTCLEILLLTSKPHAEFASASRSCLLTQMMIWRERCLMIQHFVTYGQMLFVFILELFRRFLRQP